MSHNNSDLQWVCYHKRTVVDWVELSPCEDVFLLLRDFVYMGDLFNCSKRKIRTSDSDSETKSPEGKKLKNYLLLTTSEKKPLLTTTREAQALVATNNMEDITKQLKLILCKLFPHAI